MWWKQDTTKDKKAVAYYRHSAQDRQENSVPLQREQVYKFAQENNIEIVKEFADEGKSGLSTEGRDGFKDMLENYIVENKGEIDYILVLDVSRWGRFLDTDLSSYYTYICKSHGIQVIYTTIGFPKENDLMHFLHLSIERYRAASYSRELSVKVFKGCVKIAEQGFRAGAPPPYGLNRLLLDEHRDPISILKPGQRKSIQNQRVTLAPGDIHEVEVINRIFNLFVKKEITPIEISNILNRENIFSANGKHWTSSSIRNILKNEMYTGTMVYNKTSQKLTSPVKKNPKEEWVRKEDAFEGIIEKGLFNKAKQKLSFEEIKYTDEEMIKRLRNIYEKYGIINGKLIKADSNAVSPTTYSKHFNSIYYAYQKMYEKIINQIKQDIHNQLKTSVKKIEQFNDYLVLDDSFSIMIQPSIPMAYGYEAYWFFKLLAHREEIDLTLGVPLSNDGKYQIMGYLYFPMILMNKTQIKMFSSVNQIIDFFGYSNLDSIKDFF